MQCSAKRRVVCCCGKVEAKKHGVIAVFVIAGTQADLPEANTPIKLPGRLVAGRNLKMDRFDPARRTGCDGAQQQAVCQPLAAMRGCGGQGDDLRLIQHGAEQDERPVTAAQRKAAWTFEQAGDGLGAPARGEAGRMQRGERSRVRSLRPFDHVVDGGST